MKVARSQILILSFSSLLSACNQPKVQPHAEAMKLDIATVETKDFIFQREYACKIHSHKTVEVRTPVAGKVAAIPIREGQPVQRDDLLFQVETGLDEKPLGAEAAETLVAIRAPCDGIVDRLPEPQGSFVLKGETLTTLSDRSRVWVDFEIPETHYLEFLDDWHKNQAYPDVKLLLANRARYPEVGKVSGILAGSSQTGNISFRAGFPNPNGLLLDGQAGTLLLDCVLKDAIVIPQRAVFEKPVFEKFTRRYVYVIDQGRVAHEREIFIGDELEGQFVVRSGVSAGDRIVVGGVGFVRDGDRLEK